MENSDNIKSIMEVEYLTPNQFNELKIDLSTLKKFPIDKLASVGIGFHEIGILANQAKTLKGQSGIYYVNTMGKQMFQTNGQNIGVLANANGAVGGGLARISKVPINPTMLLMSIVIMGVEMKIDTIIENQKEILDFLKLKESSNLKGNLKSLEEIYKNFKFNWNNKTFKDNKIILIQHIKKEAIQSIQFNQDSLSELVNKKLSIRNKIDFDKILIKFKNLFIDYQLAVYVYAYSTFLELLFEDNFDVNYLNNHVDTIKEIENTYFFLYNEALSKIEYDSKKLFKSHTYRGMSKALNLSGKLVEKTPLIKKTQLDEKLLQFSSDLFERDLDHVEDYLNILSDTKHNYIEPFIENINLIKDINNKSNKLMFDEEYVYLDNIEIKEN